MKPKTVYVQNAPVVGQGIIGSDCNTAAPRTIHTTPCTSVTPCHQGAGGNDDGWQVTTEYGGSYYATTARVR